MRRTAQRSVTCWTIGIIEGGIRGAAEDKLLGLRVTNNDGIIVPPGAFDISIAGYVECRYWI